MDYKTEKKNWKNKSEKKKDDQEEEEEGKEDDQEKEKEEEKKDDQQETEEENWELECEKYAEMQRRWQFKNTIKNQSKVFQKRHVKLWNIKSPCFGYTMGYVGYRIKFNIQEKPFEKDWRKYWCTIPIVTDERNSFMANIHD